ncbi:MAG: hypothetical protein EP329_09260, partial [Deltaproteobacteria bacterium]
MNAIRRTLVALGLAAVIGGCGADTTPDGVDTAAVDTLPADTTTADTHAADALEVEDSTPSDSADDTTGPEDALRPLALPLDDLCEPLAATVCQVYVGCRAATSSDSVAVCREHTAATCEAGLDATRARIADGALRYDADAARACLTRVGLLACGPLDTMLAQIGDDCAAVFTGQRSAGAACTYAGDCAPGLLCAPDAGGGCPG